MLRLSVLGQIELRDGAGGEVRPVLAQPKRLALLVYLIASTPVRFHRRDGLLTLFWPERSENDGRNALRQAIHQLRQSLGSDVIVSRGADSVGVDATRIACDAAGFETALDRGMLADALAAYRGDLLPGFSIAGAAGFNEWLDETRARLRHRAARAAWALAEQQERTGMLDAAIGSARRAAELTLHDEPALRQLVSLLGRIGDFSGAIRAYEDFAARLRRDLDLDPSLETRALVDAIRARNRNAASPGPAVVAHPIASSADANGTHSSNGTRSTPTSFERTAVSIAMFENLTGDAALDFVGRLAASAVAEGLGETRLVNVISAETGPQASASPGAEQRDRLIVGGTYHLSDDSWRLSATLRAADGRTVGTIPAVTARRERPWEAAHELSRRVSGAVAGHLDPRVASWADAVSEPPSFEAHRTHLLGMELHLRGEYRAAISHFLRAAQPQTGFTVPLLWAIQASCNLEEYEQAAAIHEELASSRSRLAPAERLGCDYFGAVLAGDRGSAFRILRTVAELVPDSEVLAQLGREAMFFNHPRYAADVHERLDPERGWMPSWTPYWRRLTEAYHMLGDHVRESAAARRARLQHPEAISTLLYEARAYAALGDIDAVRRTADEAVAMVSDRFASAGDVLFTSAQELRSHGHQRASAEMLARAIDWQRHHDADESPTFVHRLRLVRMYYEAERWQDAAPILSELRQQRRDDVDVIGCLGTLAARESDEPGARSAISALRAKTGRFHFGRHLVWAARIAAVLGDTTGALSLLRGAFARGSSYGVDLHTDIDLSLLSGDERFRELLRPKG